MSRRNLLILKIAIFTASLFSLALLAGEYLTHTLGAEPVTEVTHTTGSSALIFLMLTLAISPVRKLSGWLWLIRFRRMLGLFAFFYASLHLATYLWLDKSFDPHDIWKDVLKRPFITAGFIAWLLMAPLAVTSTQWALGKMGGKRWQALHRLIYFSAIAGVVHFYWLVKKDVTQPVEYGVLLAGLLLWRLVPFFKRFGKPSGPAKASLQNG